MSLKSTTRKLLHAAATMRTYPTTAKQVPSYSKFHGTTAVGAARPQAANMLKEYRKKHGGKAQREIYKSGKIK